MLLQARPSRPRGRFPPRQYVINHTGSSSSGHCWVVVLLHCFLPPILGKSCTPSISESAASCRPLMLTAVRDSNDGMAKVTLAKPVLAPAQPCANVPHLIGACPCTRHDSHSDRLTTPEERTGLCNLIEEGLKGGGIGIGTGTNAHQTVLCYLSLSDVSLGFI